MIIPLEKTTVSDQKLEIWVKDQEAKRKTERESKQYTYKEIENKHEMDYSWKVCKGVEAKLIAV